ncbi:aspartyl/asparaginyl beta-hydroxylase domain-containing protein [Pseudoalteromonas fuliginea]|uniref:aspartyl/asparaginyl beta-hydroxylase domain-containing protein n=1 Tax=Pseudoalteromonas fuliginea TaxID=1872678 RepID=UPI00317157D9
MYLNKDNFKKKWALGNCNDEQGLVSVDLGFIEDEALADIHNEIEELVKESSASSVADPKHITNWTKPKGKASQYSLFNTSGDFNDFSTDHNGSNLNKKTTHLELYPVLKKLIDSFPNKLNCRLNRMGSNGGGLSPHEEHIFLNSRWVNLSSSMRIRIHIVLKTNEQSKMYLRNEEYHYSLGKVYAFNNGAVHSAINNGKEDRYHIVMDCVLNDETFDFLVNSNSLYHSQEIIESKPTGTFEWDTFESYGGLDSIYKKIGIKNARVLSKLYEFSNIIRAFIIKNGLINLK